MFFSIQLKIRLSGISDFLKGRIHILIGFHFKTKTAGATRIKFEIQARNSPPPPPKFIIEIYSEFVELHIIIYFSDIGRRKLISLLAASGFSSAVQIKINKTFFCSTFSFPIYRVVGQPFIKLNYFFSRYFRRLVLC